MKLISGASCQCSTPVNETKQINLGFKRKLNTLDSIKFGHYTDNVFSINGGSKVMHKPFNGNLLRYGWFLIGFNSDYSFNNDTTFFWEGDSSLLLSYPSLSGSQNEHYERKNRRTVTHSKLSTKEIEIFTDSVNNQLTITNTIPIIKLILSNINGNDIAVFTLNDKTTKINLNKFTKGVYDVKIIDSRGVIMKTERVIITH